MRIKTDSLLRMASAMQEFYLFGYRGLFGFFKKPYYVREIIEQLDYTGTGTVIIIFLVALFIGMALTLQIAAEFSKLGLQMYTGRVVGISVIGEIGPVSAALVFAGRTGSGMSSELGSMILRHQVDTLRVFGVDPLKKLITPRILSAIVMLPILTIIADAIALCGGWYIISVVNNQSGSVYWDSIRLIMEPRYIISGSLKPFIFGFLIAVISCFAGFSTHGGAAGLKNATTNAFVYSTIAIIICDFIISKLILFFTGFQV
ncbi:MAG TPA: ABC transporter permease [Chitinispirillaceae bacterium]|nr:ABC transporter permease [Chitinispirillaceae bacterium]